MLSLTRDVVTQKTAKCEQKHIFCHLLYSRNGSGRYKDGGVDHLQKERESESRVREVGVVRRAEAGWNSGLSACSVFLDMSGPGLRWVEEVLWRTPGLPAPQHTHCVSHLEAHSTASPYNPAFTHSVPYVSSPTLLPHVSALLVDIASLRLADFPFLNNSSCLEAGAE